LLREKGEQTGKLGVKTRGASRSGKRGCPARRARRKKEQKKKQPTPTNSEETQLKKKKEKGGSRGTQKERVR